MGFEVICKYSSANKEDCFELKEQKKLENYTARSQFILPVLERIAKQ